MFVEIANEPRDYDWGSRTAIAAIQGREPSGRPEAELWLGTHPGSPARIASTGRPLAEVSGELPFLLKLLAAEKPLSLQLHPAEEHAVAGFARENALGIPVDAPERIYRDDRAKAEMLVALSDPFLALAGFRPAVEVRAALEGAGDPRLATLLDRLREDSDIAEVLAWIVEGGTGVADLVAAVPDVAQRADGPGWDAVRRVAAAFPGDRGIVASLLLHPLSLGAGDAVALVPGTPHAYLSGTGVELMAASDNVVRGGLTVKHVDAAELLRTVDARPGPPPILRPAASGLGERTYRMPDANLELRVTDTDEASRPARVEETAILVCLRGGVIAEGVRIGSGAAAYLHAADVLIESRSSVVVATGPPV